MASYYFVKRDSKPLRDRVFCSLGWDVRGFYDALYMLTIDLVSDGTFSPDNGLTVDDIAWHLRADPGFVLVCLEKLQAAGYTSEGDDGWKLTRYEEEQRVAPGVERVNEHRKRARNASVTPVKRECNASVTKRYNNVTPALPDIDIDIDIDKDKDVDRERDAKTKTTTAAAAAQPPINKFAIYEKNIGPLTPVIAEQIIALEEDTPDEAFEYSVREAVLHDKRSWKYVMAILKRVKVEGYGPPRSNVPKQGAARAKYDTSELDNLIAGGT